MGGSRPEAAGWSWGHFWSTYKLTATPKAGDGAIEDEGKAASILTRQPEGRWRVARLIANSDRAPPAADSVPPIFTPRSVC
jgi:hypothetical protein